MAEAEVPQSEASEEVELNVRKILFYTVVGVAVFLLVVGGVAYLFKEPLLNAAKEFVRVLDGPGVGLGFFLPDALTLPFPADVGSGMALMGGMSFWKVTAWGSAGSILGGCIGYWIGRGLGHTRPVTRLFERRGREVHLLMKKYGDQSLFVAVVTPLPYSIACWAAGALKMPFKRFFFISLFRAPRVALYLFLIDQGVLTLLG